MCFCIMLQNLDMLFDALLSTAVRCGMTAILRCHNCTTMQKHGQPSNQLKHDLRDAATWYFSSIDGHTWVVASCCRVQCQFAQSDLLVRHLLARS